MLANAATRSILEGTDFGDNVLAALPDVIAQTVFDLARFGVVAKPRLDSDMTIGPNVAEIFGKFGPALMDGKPLEFMASDNAMQGKAGTWRTMPADPSWGVPAKRYYDEFTVEEAAKRVTLMIRAWESDTPTNLGSFTPRQIASWRAQQVQNCVKEASADGNSPLLKLCRNIDIYRPSYPNGSPALNAFLVPSGQTKVRASRVSADRPAGAPVVRIRATTTKSPETQTPDIIVSGQSLRPSSPAHTPLSVTNSEQSFTQPSFDLGMLAAPQFNYNSPFGSSAVTNAINHSISASNRQSNGGSGAGIGLEVASATASFVPVLGTALGFYSLATGKDLITGKSVSRGEAAFGILLSAVPFGSIITKGKKFAKIGGEVAERIDDGAAVGRRIDEMAAAESVPLRLTPQQVKAKIFGTAQSTGETLANGVNPHAMQSYRESISLARNPDIDAVFLNQGYNTGLGLAPRTISPNLRPDVLGRYFDGRVARIEVRSATDIDDVLIRRNLNLNSQIVQQGFTPLYPRVVPPRGQ